MRIVPPIRPVRSGKILDTNLINHIIQRTEYGAELLARYKMVAGTNMFVEQAANGLGISYLTALAGGAGDPVGSGSAGTGSGGAGTGTGALTEAAILNASSTGDMLCRTNFNAVNKGAADVIVITWNVTIS